MPRASEEEAFLRVLDTLALCAEPLFALSERHRIIFWNKAVERLLGFTYDDVVGRACGEVLAGVDAFGNRYCNDLCPVISIAQRGDCVKQFSLQARTKDGRHIPLDIATLKFVIPQSRRMVLAHIAQPGREAVAAPREAPAHPNHSLHPDSRVRSLTMRENEILAMVASGRSTSTIAGHLGISPLTARNHIQHLFSKLEVHSKAEAAAFAYKMGIIQ